MTNIVNYAVTHFRYVVPMTIDGEPTNKILKRLNTDLRAIGSSVEIDWEVAIMAI